MDTNRRFTMTQKQKITYNVAIYICYTCLSVMCISTMCLYDFSIHGVNDVDYCSLTELNFL